MDTFVEQILPNSQSINTAFRAIKQKTEELCGSEKNLPLVRKIYHSHLTMVMNIKTLLISFAAKYKPASAIVIPSPLPFLFPAQTSSQDLKSTLFSMVRSQISPDEVKMILFMIETEKVNLAHDL